jgi:hypothetical protein
MSDIHDNGPRSASRHSAADDEAMEQAFHLAVDVQVHAGPAELHQHSEFGLQRQPLPVVELNFYTAHMLSAIVVVHDGHMLDTVHSRRQTKRESSVLDVRLCFRRPLSQIRVAVYCIKLCDRMLIGIRKMKKTKIHGSCMNGNEVCAWVEQCTHPGTQKNTKAKEHAHRC